ncbi:MAG: hypothetical protein IKU83_00570, partial [Lachnospiraceae bacterium]|nr:hypothetical protein [Lachnospiraceae bacterium]
LKNAEYKGSAALYEQIFAWKASVRAYVSLRIGMQTGVSFEAALSGGDGTSTKVKFVAKVNGQTHTYCDNKLYAAGDKPSCQFSGMTDVTKWKYNVTVYDGDGNKIGSFSGVPED